MGIDHKQRRRWWQRKWKKARPFVHYGILAAPFVVSGLVAFSPKTSSAWPYLIAGLGITQILKDVWKEIKDKQRIQSPDFFPAYIELLTKGVGLMQDVNQYPDAAVQYIQRETLQNVCDMVALYYEEHKKTQSKDKFNASIMVSHECADWLELRGGRQQWKESVRFFDANRQVGACTQVLVLTDWAREPNGWAEFVLPVDGDPDYVLPGAPRAFAKDELQVIADTLSPQDLNQEMLKHASAAQQKLRNYFEDNKDEFRSFFSLPLHADNKVVGILNVQSKDVDILGIDNENRDVLEMCLRPFCSLLAALIARENIANSD